MFVHHSLDSVFMDAAKLYKDGELSPIDDIVVIEPIEDTATESGFVDITKHSRKDFDTTTVQGKIIAHGPGRHKTDRKGDVHFHPYPVDALGVGVHVIVPRNRVQREKVRNGFLYLTRASDIDLIVEDE